MYRKTYIEVNLDRLEENIESIIKNHPEYQYYIGVVKGNCYGHGSYLVNYLIKKGVNYLAVSSLEEGIKIRKYYSDFMFRTDFFRCYRNRKKTEHNVNHFQSCILRKLNETNKR